MKHYNTKIIKRLATDLGIATGIVFCLFVAGIIWICVNRQENSLNGTQETRDDFCIVTDANKESGVSGNGIGERNSSENENVVTNWEKQSDETWKLTLVNPWIPLPEDYSIRTVELINGQSIDERCYSDLQEMMDACRAAGLSPYICSSYRTWEKQSQLFEKNVKELMSQGYSEEEARIETSKAIAVPGTSEHQLGLAVDIVDKNYQVLDETQEDTEVQHWLMENSWRYGFILRYPTDKSNITGIVYEPWHYRYVGREAASEIYHENICLEEYLEKISLPE